MVETGKWQGNTANCILLQSSILWLREYRHYGSFSEEMMDSIQITWKSPVVRKAKKINGASCLRPAYISQKKKKPVLATCSRKPQGTALFLTTKSWCLQSVWKQQQFMWISSQLSAKQSSATMISPQITTAEIRNLRYWTGATARDCTLKTTFGQVEIIFPALNRASELLQEKARF